MRTTKTRVIGLVLAGAVMLSGAIYATTALAAGGTSTETAPTAQQSASTQGASTTAEWREVMLDMLEDHMGLTGPKAEEFADEMTEHMQGLDQDFDVQEMVDRCTQYGGPSGDGTYGPGMMGDMMDEFGMMDEHDLEHGGYGMMDDMMDGDDAAYEGWHMMGWESTTDADSTDQGAGTQAAPGSQENRFGSMSGGMMDDTAYSGDSTPGNRDMMDAAPTTAGEPSGQTGDTPAAPGPQRDDFGSSPADMMDGAMMGGSMM